MEGWRDCRVFAFEEAGLRVTALMDQPGVAAKVSNTEATGVPVAPRTVKIFVANVLNFDRRCPV